MKTNYPNSNTNTNLMFSKEHKRGKIAFGLLLILVGSVWMAKEMGVAFPDFLFHWSVILILFGLYNLIKHGFTHASGYILLLVGSLFLLRHAYPEFEFRQYVWPIAIICLGLFTMFQPWTNKRRFKLNNREYNLSNDGNSSEHSSEKVYDPLQENHQSSSSSNSLDFIQVEAILSGSKKSIHTQNFLGGDISVIMGGAEVNLAKCQIQGKAVLNLNAIMGGIEIICPPDWKIENNISAVLGGVTDKRWNLNTNENSDKILVLLGSAIMGGIEIR